MTRDEQRALAERVKQALLKKYPAKSTYDIARELGCCPTTVARIARVNGIKMERAANTRRRCRERYNTDALEADVRRLWEAGMPVVGIAQAVGRPWGSIYAIAQRLGLKHSDEYIAERRAIGRAHSAAYPRDRAEMSRARKELYSKERMRIAVGLPRQTRMHLSEIPLRFRRCVQYLVREYGYFRDSRYQYTLFYDSETNRLPETYVPKRCWHKSHCERYFTEKYGITFQSAEE